MLMLRLGRRRRLSRAGKQQKRRRRQQGQGHQAPTPPLVCHRVQPPPPFAVSQWMRVGVGLGWVRLAHTLF